MSKEKTNIPKANLLMGSMRFMGYSFEAAVADIIDNSISAHSSVVKLLFPSDPLDEMAVGILDDGDGMTNDELFEAMRYGSSSSEELRREDDLGRFGLGMKSASLSQCRVLTVVSKKNKNLSSYTWDYNLIQTTERWVVLEHTKEEIVQLPYFDLLNEQEQGTLVIWQDFDVLSKSSDGQVFKTLHEFKPIVCDSVALVFHRYLSGTHPKLVAYVNNQRVKAMDPFLESHQKTTYKKERFIAINDSNGIERQIKVKPFILPYGTDLKDSDKKSLGGIENLRSKQGFYIYRNCRLIIWGTWFGMESRGELTKNARIRVDIPNTLDDIWSIDIKKQTAAIPKRIQNQLKETVREALDISVKKQTHRGRPNSVDDNRDYIWDRMEGRNNTFYYQINRQSELFKFITSQMTDDDCVLLEKLVKEIERNIPTQQMYVDKSNEALSVVESDSCVDDIFELSVGMINVARSISEKPVTEIIDNMMKSEPFFHYPELKDKLIKKYENEHN